VKLSAPTTIFCAACAACSLALGDPTPIPIMPDGGHAIGMDVTPGLSGPGHGGYTPRVLLPVYQTNDTTPLALGDFCNYIVEDVSFVPGPWASPQARAISQVQWRFQCVGWTGPDVPPIASFDAVFQFWNSGNFLASPMMPLASTPFAFRVVHVEVATNFSWTVTSPFAVPVDVPADNCWVGIKYVQTGSYGASGPGIRLYDRSSGSANPAGQPAGTQIVQPRFDALTFAAGSSSNSYGRDRSGNNRFEGGAIGSSAEHVTDVAHQTLRLTGEALATQPTPNFTICGPDLADGTTVSSDSLPGAGVRWFRICLPGNATDAALRFLDIDTETSATPVAIGVFSPQGARLASDDGLSGSTGHSQVSFGVGRRAQFVAGQGKQYDGRCGQLTASTGAGNGYFIAVAPQGSTFGAGFTVTPGAGPSGAYNLRLTTNINGTPLAPAVPPIANHDYGTINFPDSGFGQGMVPGMDTSTGFGGVIWTTFNLAAAASGSNFLDIDFARLSPNVDSVAYIFNSAGDRLYFDDSSGPTPDVCQFSLGATHNATHPPNTVPFTGQTPVGNTGLPAGQYYMAIALYPTQDLGAGGGRFHVRGTSGSNLVVGADLYTGVTGPTCDTADFNGDGDTGTDLDIEAFFACLAGSCCAMCPPDADFNRDGDTGTDLDIEAFFRVLGGLPC